MSHRESVNPHSFQSFSQAQIPEAAATGKGESELMREHTRLPTMMGIMRKYVRHHRRAGGPRSCPTIPAEGLDSAIGLSQSLCQHFAAAPSTLGQRHASLPLRTTSAVEWCRERQMRGRKSQPFAADIMNMREHRSDGTSPGLRELWHATHPDRDARAQPGSSGRLQRSFPPALAEDRGMPATTQT